MSTPNSIESKLITEIDSLLDKLQASEKDSEEYNKLVERLAKLHKLKSEEHNQLVEDRKIDNEFNLPFGLKPPSIDAALTAAVYLFGILWITRYEKENVLSTKALGFIPKPR